MILLYIDLLELLGGLYPLEGVAFQDIFELSLKAMLQSSALFHEAKATFESPLAASI